MGFGAIQISGGLSYLFGIPNTLLTQLSLILVVTVLFMLSAQTGLQRGIKYLSNINLLLQYSFFHWGFHPWAIYAIVGLCLAYFQFRKQSPGLISHSCRPLLGNRVEGSLGHTIDVIAVFATVFGVATSLGFGAIQISGGLSYLFGIPNTLLTQLSLILVVTVLFMLSAQTGLQRGIKYLSNINLLMASSLILCPREPSTRFPSRAPG